MKIAPDAIATDQLNVNAIMGTNKEFRMPITLAPVLRTPPAAPANWLPIAMLLAQ